MPVATLTNDNFDAIVRDDGIVLLECWASWCKGCKEFAVVFERAAEKNPDHTFAKVDTQAEGELTKRLGVSHTPTLILFRDGILLLRQPGYAPEEALHEIIGKAERLDMDRVRAAMEEEATETPA
jgi:thioredoxin 1